MHLGFVWIGEWKSERMENCGRMEKWENRKYLVFPFICLVGEKKRNDGKCNLCKLTIIPSLHNR